MKKISFIVVFLAALFWHSSAAPAQDAKEISSASKIVSVTIFPDRATVVRRAEIKLAPGAQSVVFSGLPTTLIPNSLRAAGRGTAAVKILGIEADSEFLDTAVLPEVKKLQAEIEALRYLIGKIKGEIEVLDAQEKFLLSIQASTTARASEQVAQGKPDTLSWEKVMDFVAAKMQGLKEKQLAKLKEQNANEAQLDALKKKLDAIKPSRPQEAKKVAVLVDAAQAGDFSLELSYTVTNARWMPLYTMRALPDSSEIELTVTGVIQQRSGENWEGVKAQLSTSSPALESQPAELNPWLLDIYVPRPVYKSAARPSPAPGRGVEGGVIGGVLGGVMAPAPPPLREAEPDTAAVMETGIHVNFEIRRPVDVPSDGAPHKVPIDSQKLKVKFDYVAVPKLKDMMFLRGSLKNTLPYPLLPGNADLFIMQDFVGTTQLPHVAADDEAKLYFGEDRQIKVAYEQVKREKIGAGFLSKTEKLRLAFKITVQNLRKTPVAIEVMDQLPVSQNSKIEVKDAIIQPAAAKKDDKGLLTWTLTLAPQEKKEITIDFTIEYPKDATIIGI
ncbi:MAG: mucoidy inhibitor MuiA family protein [Candidatus Aminicenantales bacterium]